MDKTPSKERATEKKSTNPLEIPEIANKIAKYMKDEVIEIKPHWYSIFSWQKVKFNQISEFAAASRPFQAAGSRIVNGVTNPPINGAGLIFKEIR
ncbi:MAG: hypothetical protein A3F46_06270 [Legionellales bacterium RIFCSPHIGHO2_12_FULL_42_9]|nr:MAG: hypothetical protein A3F46_06270 [Legionellales bacterium RIFCSPHIGHO2_12_FULL_42_9]